MTVAWTLRRFDLSSRGRPGHSAPFPPVQRRTRRPGPVPAEVPLSATGLTGCAAWRRTGTSGCSPCSTRSSARWPRRCAGPVCVLAGAGTGKTRAITAPHRLRRARGRLRAAPGAGRHVHRPGRRRDAQPAARPRRRRRPGPHLPRRRAAPAAVLLAARRRRRAAPAGRPQGPAGRRGGRPAADPPRPGHRARPRRRDRVGQGHHDRPRGLRRRGREGRPPVAGRPRRGRRWPGCSSTYEQVKRDRGVIDFEDVLLYTVGLLPSTRRSPTQVRDQYHHFVVDEYQDVSPLQQRLLELWLGERDELCVVGDPSQTIYSFAGATPDVPPRLPLALPRRHRGRAGARLPLHPAGRRARQPAARRVRAGPRGPARAGRAARAAVPSPSCASTPTSRPRPKAAATAHRGAGRRRRPRARDRRAVPHQRPVRDLRAGARRRRRPLRAARRRAVLRPARRCARPGCCCAARPRRPDADEPADDGPRRARAAAAGASEPPAGGGAVRERWESLAALVRLADDLAAAGTGATLADLVAELDERADAQHAPTVDGRHARLPARGEGPGVGRRLPRRRDRRHDPDHLRRDARGGRGGASPALRRRDPRPRAAGHLLGAGPRARRARVRRPSRFLDGMRAVGRSAGPALGSRAARRKGPVSCRVCGKPLSGAVARKLGRCETCPSSYDEALFERLREWRSEQAKVSSVPAYVVFTDATLMAIAETLPRTQSRAARDLRRRPRQARQVRRRRARHLRRSRAADLDFVTGWQRIATGPKKRIAPDAVAL